MEIIWEYNKEKSWNNIKKVYLYFLILFMKWKWLWLNSETRKSKFCQLNYVVFDNWIWKSKMKLLLLLFFFESLGEITKFDLSYSSFSWLLQTKKKTKQKVAVWIWVTVSNQWVIATRCMQLLLYLKTLQKTSFMHSNK